MEHCPRWLVAGHKHRPRSTVEPSSTITKHLLQCPSTLNTPISHFKVLHKDSNFNIVKILEAVEIKIRKPVLCVQKDRLYEIQLPWLQPHR